jgi:hypothetical protein
MSETLAQALDPPPPPVIGLLCPLHPENMPPATPAAPAAAPNFNNSRREIRLITINSFVFSG